MSNEPKGTVLVDDIPTHNFIEAPNYVGTYVETIKEGFLFQNEKGKIILPHSDSLAKAVSMIKAGDTLNIFHKGNSMYLISMH